MTSLNVLADLITRAKSAGADAADAILYSRTSVSVERRLGQMETLERAESQDLGLRVFVGLRSAIVSASKRRSRRLRRHWPAARWPWRAWCPRIRSARCPNRRCTRRRMARRLICSTRTNPTSPA